MLQRKALWQHPSGGSLKRGFEATRPAALPCRRGVLAFGPPGGPGAAAANEQAGRDRRLRGGRAAAGASVTLPSGRTLAKKKKKKEEEEERRSGAQEAVTGQAGGSPGGRPSGKAEQQTEDGFGVSGPHRAEWAIGPPQESPAPNPAT